MKSYHNHIPVFACHANKLIQFKYYNVGITPLKFLVNHVTYTLNKAWISNNADNSKFNQ